MANSIRSCAKTLHKLMLNDKKARATMTGDYFREIVDRSRIEESFLTTLNEYTIDAYKLVVVKLSRSKFLLARTYDRYLGDDKYVWDEDE